MSASSCHWGVWTNGEAATEYVYKDLKTAEIKEDYIFHIPARGETFEDIGRLTKKTLKPAKNLKPIFKRILYHLYSNTNISRKEKLGSEMIRLIFCKLYDEKYDQDKPPKFKIGINDSPNDVKKKIVELWDGVKEELKEDGIYEKTEKIVLDPKSIMHVVGELERFKLSKTDKDVVGDAFEVFAEKQFSGEKGEFFTPREVVKMAVEMISPQPEERMLDPACGSGGFLIYALEYVWDIMDKNPKYRGEGVDTLKGEMARKCFYGIDKEIDLVKICKGYMSIIGDGRSNIAMADSLKNSEEWEDVARTIFTDGTGEGKKFNVVLTNPPFGKKIKIKHTYILKQYDLGHKWKYETKEKKWVRTEKTKETEPQILFIELCVNLLEDGGRMAIVLPDGIFGNPTDGYIRDWIKDKCEILAIIDCPHITFMPHTHTKTSLLILRKWEKTKKTHYPIFMSIVNRCGHDTRGKDLFLADGETKDEEFSEATKIWKKHPNRVITAYGRLGFTVYADKLKDDILIPRYYNPETVKKIEELRASNRYEIKSIEELTKERIISIRGTGTTCNSNEYNIYDKIPFLRTSDLGSWEPRNFAVQNVNEDIYLKYKDKQKLQEGDILFVKDGTYRIGETIILTKRDLKMLVQGHFLLIRSKNQKHFDPHLLLYLLHTPIVRQQIEEKTFVQATLSTIGNRFNEVVLPVPKSESERQKIADSMREKILERAKLRGEMKVLFETGKT